MNHLPMSMSCPLSSCCGVGGERPGGSVDQADDCGVRGVAGADRGDGLVSHMHMLVASRGQPGWVAALTPFSVDGMIVAASTTLLAERGSLRTRYLLWWYSSCRRSHVWNASPSSRPFGVRSKIG